MNNGDICRIEIIDDINGSYEALCQYVSYNFLVYDDPATGEANVIGDNSLLFSVLY